jgi:hypothetical protein
VYSTWSLRVHVVDWARLEAAKKDREKTTPSELRIMEHLRAIKPRGIIQAVWRGDTTLRSRRSTIAGELAYDGRRRYRDLRRETDGRTT